MLLICRFSQTDNLFFNTDSGKNTANTYSIYDIYEKANAKTAFAFFALNNVYPITYVQVKKITCQRLKKGMLRQGKTQVLKKFFLPYIL